MLDKMLELNDENNLYIRISSKGVSYELKNDNQLIILRQDIKFPNEYEYDGELLSRVFNKSDLQLDSDNVTISYEFGDYQLVPSELYRDELKKDLFEQYHGPLDDKVLKVKLLPKWGIHFMYALPNAVNDFFYNLYPEADHEHFVFKLLSKYVEKSSNKMYVFVRSGRLDIIVMMGGKLQLVNSYAIKTKNDSLYFILNIFELLKLDVETLPVVLLYMDSIDDEMIDLLKQYIHNLKIKKI